MEYKVLAKSIVEGMPLDGYVRYKQSYYRVIDNCVMVCIGLHYANHSVGIQFSIFPFVSGRCYEFYDIKGGFCGFDATVAYSYRNGIDIDGFRGLKSLFILPSEDEEYYSRLVGYAREVFSDTLNLLNEIHTVRDGIETMFKFFPYDEKYWAIRSNEAVHICQMLMLCRDEELLLKCTDEYLNRMFDAQAKNNSQKNKEIIISRFMELIDPYESAVRNKEYNALYAQFVDKYRSFCEMLNPTKLALSDEEIDGFIDSISWMKS